MATGPAILSPGQMLGGFRVEEVIGVGGMAIVYRAEQVSLGRAVALKVLSNRLTSDTVFRERFRREGTHAAALEHPNIIPVYDSGQQDGQLYLAMRLVEGTNLAELIQTRGLTADQTIEILRPIASALDTAHAAGLVHRDVKPQNVLITSHGHPYLADFGVAKGSNTYGLTATGGFIGSVNYASPEQIKGLTLTSASDVYALTAVLFQCLTGHVPYERESDAAVMHAHLTEPPPTLAAVAGADSDFHTVFARGMAKDPGARYGHAGDLINAAGLSVSRLPSAVRKAVPTFPVQDAPGSAAPVRHAGADQTELVAPEQAARLRSAESHTTADRRRAPVAEPEPAVAPPSRRWRPIAGVVAVAAIAIAAIVLATMGSGADAHVTVLRRGFIQLAYSKPWHTFAPANGPVDGLRFSTPIALAGPGATLIAGALQNGAPVPGALPDALREYPSSVPHGKAVELGATAAVAYAASARGGAGEVGVWVIPTANGDLGVLCRRSRVGASVNPCLRAARTMRVVGTRVVASGADPKLAAQLSQSLSAGIAVRARRRGFSVSKLAVRAAAARAVADADMRVVQLLRRLAPQPRDRVAVGALASAVGGEAAALTGVADAASRGERAAYMRARAKVHAADRRLGSAQAALRAMGFSRVPVLRSLSLPGLPATRHRRRSASTVVSTTQGLPTPPANVSPSPAPVPSSPAPSSPTPVHHPPPRKPSTEVAKPLS